MRKIEGSAGLVLVLVWAACTQGGGGLSSALPPQGLGEPCKSGRDCASGFCLPRGDVSGYCTKPCAGDGDCRSTSPNPLACGVAADGTNMCLFACSNGVAGTGFACKNGVPVACAVAGEEACDQCGCPATLRCNVGVGCIPKVDVGEACAVDSDCRTNNCSLFAGVCRVPVGQPCTSGNCDICLNASDGWSYCSRECIYGTECNGSPCIGDVGHYTCHPGCEGFGDPSCHGECQLFEPSSPSRFYYCDCKSCTSSEPLREFGQPCTADDQCRSADCYSTSKCSATSSWCGMCTRACASSAECDAGFVCASIPCIAGETTSCGNKCVPRCNAGSCTFGSCHALATAEGSSVDICDAKLPGGAACISASDCQSGRCVLQSCAPSAGVENGGACATGSDCSSKICTAGRCKGTALIGDPCTTGYDCAVGGCCTNVCC